MKKNNLEKFLERFKHDEAIIENEGEYMFYKLYTNDNGIKRLTNCGVSYDEFVYSTSLPKYDGVKK